MRIFTDQLNRNVILETLPKKIISLVPSQTELLYSFGLDEQVAGITKFCIHPSSWFQSKTKIGGTKTLNLELIDSIAPDLIIANKEENVEEQIETLSKKFPVWISDVNDLNSALAMIRSVGEMVELPDKAAKLSEKIQSCFDEITIPDTKYRTAYLVWQNPYMTIGGDTFINDMMKRCGFINVFRDMSRYPPVTSEQLIQYNCELLLLSSEPYPFKEKHIEDLQKSLPHTRIELVDGEMFSWYGSRLLKSPSYFKSLIGKLLLGL